MKQNETLREAKRLYDLGFAILWLYPKEKRPVGSEWTTGPKKTWKELESAYRDGYNVGVRLGSPSKVTGGYLAVIDVDIKSSNPKHKAEANAALLTLVGDARLFPEVESGRGGGSKHLYFISETPFKTWNPAQSEEMIAARVPSKKTSKLDREELSEKELEDGFRIVRAWEISLYSEGRQVVLPPSVHPDTGRRYAWKRGFDLTLVPIFNFEREDAPETGSPKNARAPQDVVQDFKVSEDLELSWLPLDEATRALIRDGTWKGKEISDRSAYLLTAATGLVSAGLSRDECLTVLTEPDTVFGECAYEHAQTKSRARAAKWIWNYTLKKVMSEKDPKIVFADSPVSRGVLSEEKAKAQASEIDADTPWDQRLSRTKNGDVKATLTNCKLIIEEASGHADIVARNEFAVQDYYLHDSPWRSMKGEQVADRDIIRIKFYCAEKFGVEFADNTVNQALLEIADHNRFNPVRDYLEAVQWDGVPRVETWLSDYAGATGPENYLKAVSRKFLVAMVKRIFEPGCKFDHVLILEGNQGAGKSTLLSKLAGEWFSDQPLQIGDKDAILTMQSKWLIEFGELASLNRGEVEALKAFITQRTDRIRVPFGKRMEDFPRQCVFVGSTNLEEYLKDETGNRRFWPVKCEAGAIDFEGLAKVRNQLFAEAVGFYELGEPLYLETAELTALAKLEQSKRSEVDEIVNSVMTVLNGEVFPRNGFEMRELASQLEQYGVSRMEKADQMRLAKVLKSLGCEKFQQSCADRRRIWRVGPQFMSEPPGTTWNHLGGSDENHQNIDDFF